MKKIFFALALSGSIVACTGDDVGRPTEIPNPSATDTSMSETGSARANSTTNATANPELETNTSTNFVDDNSYSPGESRMSGSATRQEEENQDAAQEADKKKNQ